MDNTYFILTNKPIAIERLHICTWDFNNSKAAIEIGIEFSATPYSKDVAFKLSLPFLKEADTAICLMDSLIRDDDNSKFIFNDTIKANKPIKGDKRNGSIIEFQSRTLSILPIKEVAIEDGVCSFIVKDINQSLKNYIRLLIQTDISNLAVIRNGITKKTYIYDFKINEKRNLPNKINDLINQNYIICSSIKSCFCFHVIPSNYNISYLDSSKLKNIRILEADAFNRYLPIDKEMKQDDCLIVFNKVSNAFDGNYSFFSEFEQETIGNKQIILAIAANIACSLLFGIYTLRNWVKGDKWYDFLPWEFGVAIIILVIFILYLFVPWRKLKAFLSLK